MTASVAERTAPPGTPWPLAPWPDTGFPHQVIDRHARNAPDRPAIVTASGAWSRGELKRRSDGLAAALMARGLEAGSPVAVALPKSAEAIAAILGVWKAGGAFVPVGTAGATGRDGHILADCGAAIAIAIAGAGSRAQLEARGLAVLCLDDLSPGDALWEPVPAVPDRLAYIIYTSGSTGRPKGVAISHGPLLAHLNATGPLYAMDETSRELPFLPFSSDGGHERWIVPLMAGGSIVLPEDLLWTPEDIVRAVRERGVTHASLPTSYVHELATHLRMVGETLDLELCSFGGEAMPRETFERVSQAIRTRYLINGYGPTETIMTPMLWRVPGGTGCDAPTAPIGRPVGERVVHILDDGGRPAAPGAVGEIHLGGACLAEGYHRLPEKTRDLFVPDPFCGGRMYRTGDLGRFLPGGDILFCGRVDDQIQIRGYRVEPAEIETVLRGFEDVANCAVVAVTRAGRPELAAYVVPFPGVALDPRSVRRRLAEALPPAMVPSYVIEIGALPLNANHKVDRAQLPPPVRTGTPEPPASPAERAILCAWREALGTDEIGVTDNLFEIGGNSITALRVLPALRKAVPGSDPAISDLFNHPTVRTLASALEAPAERSATEVVRLRRGGMRPMLYCFPGLLVSTRQYMKLVDALGEAQPATGFICHSLSRESRLDVAVEEISARYAEIIRRESGGGPCAFLGWSWGGLLAYEAARLLAGDVDLRLVGMVDVCDMDSDFALNAVPRFSPGEREAIEGRLKAWLVKTRMRADWERLVDLMDDHAYAQFLRFVGDGEAEIALPLDGPGIGTREHTFWVLIDNALVFRRYRLEPHDCPITPWAASDTLQRKLDLIDWRRYSRRAEAPVTVPGTDHLSIIGDPAFHTRFAARLESAFA